MGLVISLLRAGHTDDVTQDLFVSAIPDFAAGENQHLFAFPRCFPGAVGKLKIQSSLETGPALVMFLGL